MWTICIPDLHGRYDLLKKALDLIDGYQEGGEVIFLGDYIDRGEQSKEVIETLMRGSTNPKWEWKIIRGNHEDMLIEGWKGPKDTFVWWANNGGDTTIASFGGTIPDDVKNWMDQLPRYLWDDHRVYTHAGASNGYPLEKQSEEVTQWMRWKDSHNHAIYGRHVVHGHTPKKKPELHEWRTNLDIGAVYNDKLAIGIFKKDTPGGPLYIEYVTKYL